LTETIPSVAFITGASSGVGAACARRFAAAGGRVVLVARRIDRLEALAAELGEAAHAIALDVCDQAAVEAVLLPRRFAEIDLLVNNAGVALGLERAHEADPEDWDRMVDTNIKGVLHCTRRLLPDMVRRDRGHIINLGSIAAMTAYPGGSVYGASKAFVRQFTRFLRADLLGSRVRITVVEPGTADTEIFAVRFKGDRARAREVLDGYRPLSAADVAEAIFWCATLPDHVNVNVLELTPIMQAVAGPIAKQQQ
jgi:NADP-dependent 3-hydroxy acid dehydrogenase YdfG